MNAAAELREQGRGMAGALLVLGISFVLVAEQVGWPRLAALVVSSLVVTYLVLYQLEFRGQPIRLEQRTRTQQAGQTCVLYAIGFVVSIGLLLALGGRGPATVSTLIRRTVVLSFPAATGASAARVILS